MQIYRQSCVFDNMAFNKAKTKNMCLDQCLFVCVWVRMRYLISRHISLCPALSLSSYSLKPHNLHKLHYLVRVYACQQSQCAHQQNKKIKTFINSTEQQQRRRRQQIDSTHNASGQQSHQKQNANGSYAQIGQFVVCVCVIIFIHDRSCGIGLCSVFIIIYSLVWYS